MNHGSIMNLSNWGYMLDKELRISIPRRKESRTTKKAAQSAANTQGGGIGQTANQKTW